MIANSGLCFPVRLNQFLVTPLGLLLTFRTQQSIARFNEAVTNWGKISSLCRSLSRTLFYHDERVPRVLWPSCGLPALSTRRPNRSTHNNQTFTVGCCERIFTASLRKTYACSPKCWREHLENRRTKLLNITRDDVNKPLALLDRVHSRISGLHLLELSETRHEFARKPLRRSLKDGVVGPRRGTCC